MDKKELYVGTLYTENLILVSYKADDAIARDAVLEILKHNDDLEYVNILDEGYMTNKIVAVIPERQVGMFTMIATDIVRDLHDRLVNRDRILDILRQHACAMSGERGKNDTYWFGDGEFNGCVDETHFGIKVPYDGKYDILMDHLIYDVDSSIDNYEIYHKLSESTLKSLHQMYDELQKIE